MFNELLGKIGIRFRNFSMSKFNGSIRTLPEDFVVVEVMENIDSLSNTSKFFLHCLLKKEGIDTFSAFQAMSRRLRVRISEVGFSGTKDKKAITFQRVSLPSRVNITTSLTLLQGKIKLYPLGFYKIRLYLGMHKGNYFKIRIRGLSGVSYWEKTLKEIEGKGDEIYFPNFFGSQRFGERAPFNHEIGRLIVKKKFKEAALLIASKSPFKEHSNNFEATYEEKVKKYLENNPTNYLNALKRVPLFILKFFVAAYQSYLFNLLLSKRIEMSYPYNRPLIGDLVFSKKKNSFLFYSPAQTVNETEKGNYDVYLPLPGYMLKFRSGKSWKLLKEIFQEEEISPEDFFVKQIPQISAAGGFRPSSSGAKNFHYKLDKEQRRVILNFFLPKGSYATVFLKFFMTGNF